MGTEEHPGSVPQLLTRHLTELRKQLRLDFTTDPDLESTHLDQSRQVLLVVSMVGWTVKEPEPPAWWRELAGSLETLLTRNNASGLAGLSDVGRGLKTLARHLESMLPLRDAGVRWRTLENDPAWEDVLAAFLGASGSEYRGVGGVKPSVEAVSDSGDAVLILVQSPFRRKQLTRRLESVGAGTIGPADLNQAWEILSSRRGVLAVVVDNVAPSNHLTGLRTMVKVRGLADSPPMVLVVPGTEPVSAITRRTGRLGAVGAWREPFRLRDLAQLLS